MKVEQEDIQFYLDRIYYYNNLLKITRKFDDPRTQVKGFGPIEFYINKKSCQWIHDFWVDGMIGFISKEARVGWKRKEKNA